MNAYIQFKKASDQFSCWCKLLGTFLLPANHKVMSVLFLPSAKLSKPIFPNSKINIVFTFSQ